MSKFHIIDLAGSERQKLTGARGDRLKEAGNINRSLSAIGNVINALTSKNPNVHIPYRDTKLTYLLKDSLGGNCKTHMIANVSASACCFAETLSTLSFAERAKMIQNKISRQEKMDGNFDQLKLELDKQIAINQRLQEEVSQYQSGNPHVQMAMRQPSMQQGFMAPRDDAYPFRDEPTWVQAELRQSMYLAPDGSPMGTASPMVHAPLLADNARLQNELYETKQDNQNKEGEIQQLNRELEEMRFEADEQLSQNTAKEAELQSIRVEINRLHSVIAQGEPGISQQFVETHTQLLQLQDALTQMQPELDSVNSEADELRNQVATCEHAINKKDMEITDLTSQKETFDFQLGESKCQIADLVEQCNTFIDMDEELMRERKASENLQRTNEELSAQIRSLMEKNQAKDFELNELRNRPSEDRDKVSLQQQVDQLKATIARESQKYQNLEMQLNLTKNDNQTLRNQVTEKKNEIERLNNAAGPDINFMWCQRDLKYAQERVKELEQNIQREQMEKSQLNERLIKEKRQQDQKIFSISKELDEKQKLIEDKNNHIDVIQAKITKLQEKHERSRDQKDDLRRQVYKLQEKFDILEDEVTIKDNTINELVAPNNGNARIQVFNRVRAENTQLKEEVEAAKKQGEEDVKQALNEIIKVIGKKNFIPENAALNPLHFITAFVSRAEVGLQFSSQSPTPQENMHPNERNSPYIQTPAQQLYLDSQGFPSSNISGTRPPLNDRPGTSVYKFPPNPFG